ncbi:MAG: hypothetical protein M1816_004836 [Peltula sp. TS41687]|nr:MAG: hypothetical protein M1816_004836 [Peltula sp. TS41687]
MDVELYVYDLSRGLAKQMSLALLGTYIDAVYHTSIVFGGVEIFFGPGIVTCRPGSTHHGAPIEKIQLGKTSLPQDVIAEYLESLKRIYTAESYDLFLHNCNHFSNDLSTFLVGKGIPSRITSLPQTVLNTPFGQMLKPQLDRAMRSMTQAPPPPSSAPAAQVIRSHPASMVSANGNMQSKKTASVRNVTDFYELHRLLDSASDKCAVIFFTSSTCPPCKLVYPAYDELAAEAGNRAIFIKVDIRNAYHIADKFEIAATPTFITFLLGKKENRWMGADESLLRGNVGRLMKRHPHFNLHLPTLTGSSALPLTYERVPPLDKLIAKMGDAGHDPSVVAMKEFLSLRSTRGAAEATLPDLRAFGLFVQEAIHDFPNELLFTVVDLLRAAMADPRCSGYYAEERDYATIMSIVTHVNQLQRHFHLRLVALQMLCNLFTSPLFPRQALGQATVVSPIIQFLSANLTGAEDTTRIAAGSLAYNIASFNHQRRIDDHQEVVPDSEQLQLLAALVEAISAEDSSSEALKRNLMALGLLVHRAPKDAEIVDYIKAVDAAQVVKGKSSQFPGEKLIKEVGEELLGKGV